uniref:Uncharacterized protein n=1 Tax=Polytomella parva TaxID=51329 RepID=A0A7S0V8C7_9CHLO|mmetsp:Transcript_30177/g.55138  ORF Transcript_30177/g.55138 Transcript_30177/m.55138 type:complete len:180 (+) Transcript_30177:70-609(+)
MSSKTPRPLSARIRDAILRREPEKDRPFLVLCDKCHGKGMIGFNDAAQDKKYRVCQKCTNGNLLYGLGVKLKCLCQKESSPYHFLTLQECQSAYARTRHVVSSSTLKAMEQFQSAHSGKALLILCDNCDAIYITSADGNQVRISGDKLINDQDKETNKKFAESILEAGIQETVVHSHPH